MKTLMNIYFDNCCLNRPFDDQTQIRIHLESEAIKAILELCEQGQWRLMCSHVNYFEIARTPDESRRKKLELLISPAEVIIELTPEIILRAKVFESSGLKAFDAMHLACAETQADVLLTVDDGFLKKAASLPTLRISVKNPLTWLEEVLS